MNRTVVLGLVILLIVPASALAANDLGVVSGQVRDAAGTPLSGALVIVAAAAPQAPERMAFTDRRGLFTIPNLFPGEYSVRVTMPRFLPALKHGIHLNAGGSAILTVNLQNALDAVRRAVSRDKTQSEDIVWTLRSSRSTQPVLHLTENASKEEPSPSIGNPDYTGYFQFYSKSVETSSGTTEGMGSQFSVTMPLDPGSRVTVVGQYSELRSQPRGFGASYEFVPSSRHRASIGVNVRQSALFGEPLHVGSLKELRVEYGEDFQWSDHLVFTYGAELGRAEAAVSRSYLRPRFGASWVPQIRTMVSLVASAQAPAAADDPIRGKEYFDRTMYVPPTLERYSHMEASLSHIFSENVEFSAAAFRDRTDREPVFVSAADGRRGVLILDTTQAPSQGLRVHLNRTFRSLEAGIGFTAVTGLVFDDPARTIEDTSTDLRRKQFQVITARLKTDLDMTNTEITAVYRWISGLPVSQLDAYQRQVEYNDPTLSLTVAQDLPAWRMFPGKIQAILDARNVFEQCFGFRRPQVAQYPRLVKGGINIKF